MVGVLQVSVLVPVAFALTAVSLAPGVWTRVDPLFRARSHAACIKHSDKMKCESEFGLLTRTKPGKCPERRDLKWHEAACVNACRQDVECPGTEKCCSHECGTTCQNTAGLDQEPGLPAVPSGLTVASTTRERAKLIEWSPASAAEGVVVYVLQQRSHVGLSPDQQLFGPWKPRSRRRRNRQILTELIPAHWYQVRVAAVNANGSRGYSPPSPPFMLQAAPSKPNEPRNLTVLRPGWVDGRLWAELRWRWAYSDLPLQHYKVFWSHCIKSEIDEPPTNACKHKSVIVKHKTMNYKEMNYILKDLEPQSLYFIQVQAVTIPYGKKKLSSEKAVTFINTNELKNATYNWKVRHEKSVRDLRVINYFRSAVDKLEARIVWEGVPGRFLVKWSPHSSCKTVKNNPTNEVTTEEFEFDIDNLEFNCKYQVSVSAINGAKSAKLTFTTPLCQQVTSRLPCS